MRGVGIAAAGLVLAAGLTACGGSNDEFCTVAQDDLDATSSATGSEFDKTFKELTDKAPDELSDDLDTLHDGLVGPTSGSTKVKQDAQVAYEHIDDWIGENCD